MHDVYVQIHNVANISIPVRIAALRNQTQQLQLAYLPVGVVFGTLALLIVTCLVQSWSYRDYTYSLYAAYASILMLTIFAWTGVAGHLLWNHLRSGTTWRQAVWAF